VKQDDLTPEQIAKLDKLIAGWDAVKDGPALRWRDLERHLDTNGSRPASSEVLRLLDVAEMVRTPPPAVPWIIEGLAVAGTLTLLSGKEGEGKSLLSMALAAGVGAGHDIAGFACHQHDVMIIDAENGEYEIHRRVKSLGLPSVGVDVVEADGFHLGRDLDALEALLVEAKPGLVILDSFRSLWPAGEENDSGAVAAVLDPLRNLLRRLQIAGILLHHVSRAGNDYRGTSAIGAAIELGFRLGRNPDDPEARDRRFLRCFKCRPAPEPEERWLRLHLERGQVFIDAADPFDSDEDEEKTLPPVRAELAPALLAAATEPIAWADLARAIGRSPKDGTARRLRDDLLGSEELERLEDGRLLGAKGVAPPDTAGQSQEQEGCQGAVPPIGVPELAPAEEAEAERIAAKFPEMAA
jgi:AAA domain